MRRLLLLPFLLLPVAQLFAQAQVEAHIRPDASLAQKAEDFNAASTFAIKYAALQDWPNALDQLNAADTIQPNNPAILYDSAVVLFHLGRFADAQGKLDAYRQLYPDGKELDRVKSLQLDLDFEKLRQKKQQEAQDYLELFNRARFTYDKGDIDGAIKLFAQAEEQRANDAAVAFNQAILYESKGDYIKATERLRHYLALAPDAADKTAIDQKVFALQSEVTDAESMIVCPFCGAKLARGTVWCPHCWHGPYLTASAVWNTRPCATGATATRTSLFQNNRVNQNEDLPCSLKSPSWAEALRYSKAKQRAIQDARKAEGWTYDGEILQSMRDRDGNEIHLVQGDTLQQLLATSTGDVFNFSGHKDGDSWLLDREEFVIDGQKYAKTYAYDASRRILSETVRFQNNASCGHLVEEVANYTYDGERLASVAFHGGYKGFDPEGLPELQWQMTLLPAYDDAGRVTKEDLTLVSMTKTWQKRPEGPMREQTQTLYPEMRVKKPLDVMRQGDLCAISGNRLIGNMIDLRPFYSVSPDLPGTVPFGVQKVSAVFTYPREVAEVER